MRRSAIWFVMAALWLIDAILSLIGRHGRQALLTAAVALVFVVAGVIHRSREAATLNRVR
jgi:hypothetical protein